MPITSVNTFVDHAGEYIPHEKCIILAGGFIDGKLVKAVTSTGVTYLESLYSNQEEADTRMILHACSLSQGNGRLIIRCDDTDVLVLVMYYQGRGQLTDQVFMYAGHSGKERYIPVHEIVDQLGPTVCGSLPAAHILTGCDTMCSMNRIGKKTVYSKLAKNIGSLADLTTFPENYGNVAQMFELLLYGKKEKDVQTLDEMRYLMATTTDKAASLLPPTEDAFK